MEIKSDKNCFLSFFSDQAEARRKKVKEARLRREQRIAQKKEEMLKNIEEAKK